MLTEAVRRTRRWGQLARLAGGTACLASCAGTLEDPALFASSADTIEDGSAPPAAEGGTGGCGDVTTTLFLPNCTFAGCHATTPPAAGLDLVSPGLPGRLVGKAPTGGPGTLIDPGGNPDASVLYLKLTPMPPFGLQMPEIGNKLDEAQLACVAAWIMAAASTPAAAATSDAGAGMTTLTGDAGLPED